MGKTRDNITLTQKNGAVCIRKCCLVQLQPVICSKSE
jgi:hypothetical protein